MCSFIYLHLSVYVHMHMCVQVCVYVGQNAISGVLFFISILKIGSLAGREITKEAGQLASEPQGFSCTSPFPKPSSGSVHLNVWLFNLGSGDQTQIFAFH